MPIEHQGIVRNTALRGGTPQTDKQAPEDFPRNTGAGVAARADRPADDQLPGHPERLIIPSDSPGG